MSDKIQLQEKTESPQIPSVGGVGAIEGPEDSQEQKKQKKWTLKGMLMMAICCGAPLLLLAAIPFLGATFGSLAAAGSGLLTIVALLACPVGMYLMMRMMMKDKK